MHVRISCEEYLLRLWTTLSLFHTGDKRGERKWCILLVASFLEGGRNHFPIHWLLQHCTDHVCNETFTATIVFVCEKNRGEIPPPNMTSLHWQIMCSAPLQKMAEFFVCLFCFFYGGEAEKMCRDLRTSKQIIYWHSWLSSCLGEWNFV